MSAADARVAFVFVLILLGTAADSAVALQKGRGILRRHRGVSTPQATAAAEKGQAMDARAKQFVEYYEATVRPLEIEASRASWIANVSGKEADFQNKQEAEDALDLCLADGKRFAELKAIKDGRVGDPLLARQIAVIYLEYLGRQVPPELLKKISAKSNAVERTFNVYRYDVGGKKLTDNDISRVFVESKDSAERQAAWEARMKIGQAVIGDLKAVVALRNEAAHKLGFKNFHAMQLFLGEQSGEQVQKLFDELDALTREPYRKAKAEIDAALAKSYGIKIDELRPWHYHDLYFSEVPAVLGDLPDSVYKPIDTLKACRAFYQGIGLPIDDVLERSSLYEQPGKCPHAFSTDIDRTGNNVRILVNIVPGREWLATTLHELGHASYSKYLPHTLPYALRNEAHPLCTEGVAMMFERFAQNVDWLQAMGVKVPDPQRFRAAAAKLQRNRLLIFARWCQVMFRFERELYANPDQDLNRLWWDLVEKYQFVKRPAGRDEPDFAAKYHFVGAPAYYHNYMMGELFASQVHHALIHSVLPGTNPAGAIYVGNKQAGQFMRDRVYSPGLTLDWNELTRHATGEELNAKAFAEDIKQ
jgi:peptidyl-dipeptidase A